MKEIALLFLRLGSTAFGGPAAHIAMMEEEVVKRRKWLSHEKFLDLLSATNLIPGPNSTEMALHIGYIRAGWRGLLLAGLCFIVPAVLITLLIANLYVRYGSIPELQPFVNGIRPAIIAIVAAAVIRLGRPMIKNHFAIALGALVVILSLVGVDEILLLFACGAIGLFWRYKNRLIQSLSGLLTLLPFFANGDPGVSQISQTAGGVTLTGLGLFFLKIGSILYGSGYVLVAFLQGGLVDSRHWLTQSQLFDAIAVGQFTPGPVLSTATFVGYLLLGIPGASIATAGIFLPSFVFVLISNPVVAKLRSSPIMSGFLDGVNAASLALMIAVTIKLAVASITGIGPAIVALLAAVVVLAWKVHPAWIVIGSAGLGWLLSTLRT